MHRHMKPRTTGGCGGWDTEEEVRDKREREWKCSLENVKIRETKEVFFFERKFLLGCLEPFTRFK